MREWRRRSIIKAFTWRAIATATTMALVFVFTGEWKLTVGVGVLDVISKLIFYYGHERIWNRVPWGRNRVSGAKIESSEARIEQ